MKKAFARAILAATVLAGALAADPVQAAGSTYVVDGDTMNVDGVRVRIQGINTPEKGQPCAAVATAYLRSLLAANGGNATITRTSGTDRYGRTIASVSIGGRDVGTAMLKFGVAVARYDGTDGYATHPQQGTYRAMSHPNARCGINGPEVDTAEPQDTTELPDTTEPQDNPEQTGEPFWSTAALLAIASDLGVPDFDIDTFGDNYADGANWLWDYGVRKGLAERAAAEAAESARVAEQARQTELARQAEAERQRQRASQRPSSSDGGGSSGYNGPRCYAPGGKTWKPCP